MAQQIGYPAAMKICSKDIIHKSDANGVQLNLRGDKNVRETGREAYNAPHHSHARHGCKVTRMKTHLLVRGNQLSVLNQQPLFDD